jgi:GMP synthase-like glutamine amidotransferase
VDWLSILKAKPRGRVELVQDENEDTSVQDVVFQVSELVEPYRVASSIDLEENSNFHVFDDSLVDVDAEELNVVLISSGKANVNEDDDIHIEDCNEGDDYSIDDEKEENSD